MTFTIQTYTESLPSGKLYKQWLRHDNVAKNDKGETPEMMKRIADGMRAKAIERGNALSDEQIEAKLSGIVKQKRETRARAAFAAQQLWPQVLECRTFQVWSRAHTIFDQSIAVFCAEYRVCVVFCLRSKM